MKPPRSFTAAVALLLMCAGPATQPAEAQLGLNCTVSSTGVAFGSYNVFSSSPVDSTGTVTYQCTLGVSIRINLDRGAAPSFSPRTLKNGANALNYNLYLDSARSTIWGDGSGGTSYFTDTLVALTPKNTTAYGRIPALQDAAIGAYSDSVIATIVF